MNRAATVLLLLAFSVCSAAPAAASSLKSKDFIITGTNISKQFKRFMKCNTEITLSGSCDAMPGAPEYLYTDDTAAQLKNYQFILVPGGDYDFFSELLGVCEGDSSEDYEDLQQSNPALAAEIDAALEKDVCPNYDVDPDHLYNDFMGAYVTYLNFMSQAGIPARRLDFSVEEQAEYIGDRIHKLDLLSELIEQFEADNSTTDKKQYVLIGHSFGGINISDFLVELRGGHTADMPEGKAFAGTVVRGWSDGKKADIFSRIKMAVFTNTFVQGDKSSETQLKSIASGEGVTDADPVGYYINEVLQKYVAGTLPTEAPWDKILHFVLRSNRYRVQYYLLGKNSASGSAGQAVIDAFDTVAQKIAVMSVGCTVPFVLPDLRIDPNFIVTKSKSKYRDENTLNDGLVDTFGAMFPRNDLEYLLFFGMDHGSLVLKPEIPGITNGHSYDQLPYIKTLLAHIARRLQE